MNDHSKYSPSSAYRWMACPGSLFHVAETTEANQWALEGTQAHMLAARILREQNPSLADATKEMREAVHFYASYVDNIRGEKYVEQRINIDKEVYGTADCIVLDPWEKLHIIDFKYGKQVVQAAENRQLQLYALGALRTIAGAADVNDIELHIVQPRIGSERAQSVVNPITDYVSPNGPIAGEIGEKIAIAKRYPHTYATGPWCRNCQGLFNCPAGKSLPEKAIKQEAKKDAASLSDDYLIGILKADTLVQERIKAIKTEAQKRLEDGNPALAQHFRLVRSYGHRQWTHPEAVISKYGVEAMEVKMITPAKLARNKKPEDKKWIESQTYRPDKGLKIVPRKE